MAVAGCAWAVSPAAAAAAAAAQEQQLWLIEAAGLQVNGKMQTSNPDVYAVGDIAAFPLSRCSALLPCSLPYCCPAVCLLVMLHESTS